MKKSKPTTSVSGKANPKRVEAELERLAGVSKSEGAIHLVQRENDDAPPILFYNTDKGMKLELRIADGEIWCTQAQLSALYGVTVATVNHHIKQFLDDGELSEATIRNFLIVRQEGQREVRRDVEHYGLDVAFYVGYRVNSRQGALFRRGATDILVRFAKYGYAIDVERLKAPEQASVIDELKDIIRDIRASTANVYREVRRIVSLCQDYDGSNKAAREFYARMENKLLFVATGKTAPEIIVERADATKPQMGLTYYLGKRGPTLADAKVANNYLAEGEARVKNRATTMLLDYFEDQLDQGKLVMMADAEAKLDGFIKFNGWPLLRNAGKVSRAAADQIAAKHQKIFASRA
ncbi:MAG: RhuM family protein [Micropepsaceae bacterium]